MFNKFGWQKKDPKVLFITAEVAPFSKEGGLSQVSYFLSRSLRKLGVDIRIFTPKYGTIDDEEYGLTTLAEDVEIPTGADGDGDDPESLTCNILYYENEDDDLEPPVYFLENMEYFEKRANVYNYSDDHIRFGLLSRGAIEFITEHDYFLPDIVHCNDWPTSYVIDFLRQFQPEQPKLAEIASLLSIHNTYQGPFDYDQASEMDYDDGKSFLSSFFSDRFQKQNALKRGIMHTDRINTVSETYAKELLREEFGGGLHKLLRERRGKLSGILNGLDYTDFDPATDTIIRQNYDRKNIKLRARNKLDLQKEFDLEEDTDIPIMAISGRLDYQKGIELIRETIEFILDEFRVQFIAMGSCSKKEDAEFFRELEKEHPTQVGTHLMANFELPRKIFAGADIVLMPSRYEPGGIVAIEAMRYGAVPLVRATGGLADIVEDYKPQHETGTGFKFDDFSPESFLVTVARALETYQRIDSWHQLVERAMREDFSWDKVAKRYLNLYKQTLAAKREGQTAESRIRYR